MKNLSILGSTGSIGRSTLKVVERFPERFSVTALTAKTNVELLARQVRQFSPEMAVVFDEKRARTLKGLLPPDQRVDILHGEEGYKSAAAHHSADTVVAAMIGAAGLTPTLAGIDAGKDIALANKETLVMAGDIVMEAAASKGVRILPVDSEHSAIFQCLSGHRKGDLSKILLTASGGPFLRKPAEAFTDIQPEEALNHPTWDMGQKITIDSATLMNKGLEVLEAKCLFQVSSERIEVVIHPQSIVHSMVSYRDGSVIAQLSIPDMRGAIAYALSYPERLDIGLPETDFGEIGALHFEKPDLERFPCLALAFTACEEGGSLPAVLNAANEIAVEAFLKHRISFVRIPEIIHETMNRHETIPEPSLQEILEADQWARETAEMMIAT
jgi:1-deoxy-D-xylulose-5-phosphate reductoisomerase